MSSYINTVTMEYPFYESDIRLIYPEIGEIFELPDQVFAYVEDAVKPEHGYDEKFIENAPAYIGGKWIRQFTIVAMTQEEIDERQKLIEEMNLLRRPKVHSQEKLDSTAGGIPDVIG
jgi:hypothetical protein